METITVVTAAHRLCDTIPPYPPYLPVQAGRAIHPPLPYAGDDTGESISEKNASFCELTCLYWAWKNLPDDYVGLCHYRRYFGKRRGVRLRPMTEAAYRRALRKAPVLLPKKRRYFIETTYSQYAHAHHAADLDTAREIIAARCPEYLPAFDRVMRRTSGHRFNMLVMRRDVLDAWCAWLFDVLFALEAALDISGYSDYDRRVFGFVGERLLDVWLETNGVKYREAPVCHTESQHWPKKIAAFLRRKLSGGKA